MSGLPWYKRDPDAFIRGCCDGQLTLEEVGAYALLIDEMYRRGGPLIDDARGLSGLLRIDLRVWNRLRSALIRKGKIYATAGKFLSNVRVEQELKNQYDMREQKSRAARLSAQLRRSYALHNEELSDKSHHEPLISNENARAHAEEVPGRYRVRVEEESIVDVPSTAALPPTSIDEPVAKAMEAYNEAARRAGWVSARLPIGAQRRRQVRARLKALGPDGWIKLLAEAESQPFLGGSNDRGWRMDLEFFASERGSTKILEGKYRKPGERGPADPAELKRRRDLFDYDGTWNDAWGPKPAKGASA